MIRPVVGVGVVFSAAIQDASSAAVVVACILAVLVAAAFELAS